MTAEPPSHPATKDPGEPDTKPADPPAVKPKINNQWLKHHSTMIIPGLAKDGG